MDRARRQTWNRQQASGGQSRQKGGLGTNRQIQGHQKQRDEWQSQRWYNSIVQQVRYLVTPYNDVAGFFAELTYLEVFLLLFITFGAVSDVYTLIRGLCNVVPQATTLSGGLYKSYWQFAHYLAIWSARPLALGAAIAFLCVCAGV